MPLPSFASSASGPELEATVKWFNAEKGYGFVALTDGSGDVFLHVNTLQAAGVQTVNPGATLRIRVGQGQKGRQVDQVVSVDESTATAAPRAPSALSATPATELRWTAAASGRSQHRGRDDRDGEVVQPRQGVRLHHPAVRRQGRVHPRHRAGARRAWDRLQEGQSVRMGVVQGAKGPEAGTISLDVTSIRAISRLP